MVGDLSKIEESIRRINLGEVMIYYAGAHWLARRTGRCFGPLTGTNIVGALLLGLSMQRRGLSGSIATLACDRGERYADTIYDPAWLAANGLDVAPWHSLRFGATQGLLCAGFDTAAIMRVGGGSR